MICIWNTFAFFFFSCLVCPLLYQCYTQLKTCFWLVPYYFFLPHYRLKSKSHIFTSGSGVKVKVALQSLDVKECCIFCSPVSTFQRKLISVPPLFLYDTITTLRECVIFKSHLTHRRLWEQTSILTVLCNCWENEEVIKSACRRTHTHTHKM